MSSNGVVPTESEEKSAWFWRQLKQAASDFEALPAWMKKVHSDGDDTEATSAPEERGVAA